MTGQRQYDLSRTLRSARARGKMIALQKVLRDVLREKGEAITEVSTKLGRGPSYLTNALLPRYGREHSLRVSTLLEVLDLLEMNPVAFFARVMVGSSVERLRRGRYKAAWSAEDELALELEEVAPLFRDGLGERDHGV